MLPFKLFDRENKITWIILNYQPNEHGGQYLAAREDDTSQDGELSFLTAQEISKFRLVGFVVDPE